jgi:hypothetical protein
MPITNFINKFRRAPRPLNVIQSHQLRMSGREGTTDTDVLGWSPGYEPWTVTVDGVLYRLETRTLSNRRRLSTYLTDSNAPVRRIRIFLDF